MPVRVTSILTREIMSAPPQKLHLLLIEAIIRAIRRGKQHWQSGENDKACAALIHAQRMVCEILGGFDREVNPDLVQTHGRALHVRFPLDRGRQSPSR